jgi:hypothetical protein
MNFGNIQIINQKREFQNLNNVVFDLFGQIRHLFNKEVQYFKLLKIILSLQSQLLPEENIIKIKILLNFHQQNT